MQKRIHIVTPFRGKITLSKNNRFVRAYLVMRKQKYYKWATCASNLGWGVSEKDLLFSLEDAKTVAKRVFRKENDEKIFLKKFWFPFSLIDGQKYAFINVDKWEIRTK